MAVTFIILLSCLAYGALAVPGGDRPAVQGVGVPPLRPPVVGSAGSGPSRSYLPPAQGVAGRPSAVDPAVSAPANLAPGAQRPIDNRGPSNVGGKRQSAYRPIVAAPSVRQPTVVGAPSIGSKRQGVQRPLGSASLKQRSSYAAGAAKRRPQASAARPVSPNRSSAGQKPGSRTVGSKAPY